MVEIILNFIRKVQLNNKIQKVLDIWHTHFKDEENQYSEFEPSDIEYFVSCMLYNHFDFKDALDTMKTIDLSYDFLVAVESNYDEIKNIISEISIEDELEKIEFLTSFLNDAKSMYTQDALYLINRLSYQINELKQRYEGSVEASSPEFVTPQAKSRNPLLR